MRAWVIEPPEDWEIKVWPNDGEPYAFKKTPPVLYNKRGKPATKAGEVTYSSSVEYNGGTIVLLDGVEHWVRGYRIPAPIPLPGFELISLGVGQQLNAHPPYSTQLLRKKKTDEST